MCPANHTKSGATVCVVSGEFPYVEADGTCNERTLSSTETCPKETKFIHATYIYIYIYIYIYMLLGNVEKCSLA